MLLSPNNLLKPSDGGPVAVPSQDMVLGIYYLTMDKVPDFTKDGVAAVNDKVYESEEQLKAALDAGELKVEDMIHYQTHDESDREVICTPADILGRFFSSTNQALLAYENGAISLHQTIRVHQEAVTPDGEKVSGTIRTTLGRLIFNEIIPQDLGFVKREKPEDYLQLEVDFHVGKKYLKKILEKVINITVRPERRRYWMISRRWDISIRPAPR